MTTERNQAVGVETVCSDSERDADTSDFSHISIHLVPNKTNALIFYHT